MAVPAPVGNKKAADVVPVDDQSLQIKALIKHKILNKLSRSVGPTATATSSLPEDNRASSTGGFTVPIPKADLTARTKEPLILNSVNQLPKNRARCGVTRTRPPETSTTAAVIHQEKLPSVVKPTSSQPKFQKEQGTTQAPPLIVLENKVLSPDEKIDLRALRLPKMQSVSETPIKPTGKEIKTANQSLISQDKLSEENISSKITLPRPGVGVKKVIHSANKLQMSREKLLQLAKDIQNQAMQNVKLSTNEQIQGITSHIKEKSKIMAEALENAPKSKIAEITTETKNVYPLENASLKDSIDVTASQKTSVLDKPQISIQNLETNTPLIAPPALAPPVIAVTASTPSTEISKNSSGVLSAVDFIAQLTANESLDSTDFTELSPEELSMTEKFNSSQVATSQDSKITEEELPIGKILQIQDMDILHATLCVDENKPNVLCISPNAIKLENSKETVTKNAREDINDLSKFQEPENSPDTENSNRPVSDVVGLEKKEDEKSSSQRLPFRHKKGKINLVQRNKKGKVVKPNEKILDEQVKPVEVADLETNKSDNSVDKDCEQPLKVSENETREANKVSDENNEGPLNIAINGIDELIDNPDIKTKECFKASEKNKPSERPERESDKLIKIPEDEKDKLDKITYSIPIEPIESVQDIGIEKSNVLENTEVTNNNIVKQDLDIRGYEKLEKMKPEIVSLKHKRGKINLVQRSKKITVPKSNKTESEKELKKDGTENELSSNNENILTPETELLPIELNPNTNIIDASKINLEITIKSTEKIELNKSKINEESDNRYTDSLESENPELSLHKIEVSIAPNVSSEIADELQEINPPLEVQSKKDKDVTQLYHPPKMSRKKQCVKANSNNDVSINIETKPSACLSDILSQKEPLPQGDAKVPFRQEPKNLSSKETPTSTTGIQNLLNHLAAENVVPPKKDSNSENNVNMVSPKSESESKPDEPVKMPRKKLVKTRPVLRAKRPSKTLKESNPEAVHPRKRALLTEDSPKKTPRCTTSSTSDDDATLFRGFDNEVSTSKLCKVGETDISDDATPDYDETEDDHQPDNELQDKQPVTECTNNVDTIANQEKIVEEKEDIEKQESASQSKTNNSIDSTNTKDNASQLEDIATAELITVKKTRGRPSRKSAAKSQDMVPPSLSVPELADISMNKNKTEQDASIESNAMKSDTESNEIKEAVLLTTRGKRQCRSRAEPSNSKVFKEMQELSVDLIEVTPGTKRKRQTRGSTPKSTAVDQAIPIDSELKPAKRRGRPISTHNTPLVDIATPAAVSEVTPNVGVTSSQDSVITPIPKKRGRQPKSLKLHTTTPVAKKLKTDATDEQLNESILNWPKVADFNLRLLLIRKREQLETDEELRENGRGEGALQCGLCLVRCNEDNWTFHIGEHYGVGWHKDDYPAVSIIA